MLRRLLFLFHTFSMVTTCVVIAVAMFTTLINPSEEVNAALLWQILAVSGLCTLICLIYPWDREMSKTESIVRRLLHYILINGIVLVSGIVFQWYNPAKIRNIVFMLLTIAVIFGVVSMLSWRQAALEAARMNERLEEYQRRIEQESSERAGM